MWKPQAIGMLFLLAAGVAPFYDGTLMVGQKIPPYSKEVVFTIPLKWKADYTLY
jgi:hypothetical protein